MDKTKKPIIIANWKGNVINLSEAKEILKNTEKEFSILIKKRFKESKKKPVKKDLSFYLSVPTALIYPLRDFVKSNIKFKKIIIGAQNFDEIQKIDKNNIVIFDQIKSVGAEFTILNDEYEYKQENINENIQNQNPVERINEKIEKLSKKEESIINNVLLQRLSTVSKKIEENEKINANLNKKNTINSDTEKANLFNYLNQKEFSDLSEKVKYSLEKGMNTVLFIRDHTDDIDLLSDFVKEIIKNIHYNLFERFIICYEREKNINVIEKINIADCQEKTIVIRRTIANMFGIANAKKIKIIYSGRIDDTNVKEVLENGGVDGIFIAEESVSPKSFAKILAELS